MSHDGWDAPRDLSLIGTDIVAGDGARRGFPHGGRAGHKAGHGREQIDARWSETEEISRVAEVVHEVYLLAQESTYGTYVIRAADDT